MWNFDEDIQILPDLPLLYNGKCHSSYKYYGWLQYTTCSACSILVTFILTKDRSVRKYFLSNILKSFLKYMDNFYQGVM